MENGETNSDEWVGPQCSHTGRDSKLGKAGGPCVSRDPRGSEGGARLLSQAGDTACAKAQGGTIPGTSERPRVLNRNEQGRG